MYINLKACKPGTGSLCENKKVCRSSNSRRVYYFSIKFYTSNLLINVYKHAYLVLFFSCNGKPRKCSLLKHIESRSLYIFLSILGIAKKNTSAKFQRKMINPVQCCGDEEVLFLKWFLFIFILGEQISEEDAIRREKIYKRNKLGCFIYWNIAGVTGKFWY